MKKFMIMCMMLLATTLTFTACGDDDDDNPVDNPVNNPEQAEVNQDNYYKYQESVQIQKYGTMTMIGEATFENGVCKAVQFTYIYPSKSFASQVWKSYQADAANDPEWAEEFNKYYSYDGNKTMYQRLPDEDVASMAQLGKQYVCGIVKSTVQTTVEALGQL